MDVVVEQFNNYFVNVGPDLATKIPDPGPIDENLDCLIERNAHSVFLTAVGKDEIIESVMSCEKQNIY